MQQHPYQGTNCTVVHCVRSFSLGFFILSLFVSQSFTPNCISRHTCPGCYPSCQVCPSLLVLSFPTNVSFTVHFGCNLVQYLSSLFVFFQSKWLPTYPRNKRYSGSCPTRTSTVSTISQSGCAFPCFLPFFSLCPPPLTVACKMHLKSRLKQLLNISKVLGGQWNASTVKRLKISRLNLRSI